LLGLPNHVGAMQQMKGDGIDFKNLHFGA